MLRALLTAVLLLAAPASAQAAELACTGDPAKALRYDTTVAGEPTEGRFAAPAAPPTALAVLAHGYSYTAQAYERHATNLTLRTGALSVAPRYRGTRDAPFDNNRYGAERSRGWPVKAGGEDIVAIAREALQRCPTIRTVVLYGFSMGGNASGVALASRPKRADGSPLFDFWVAVEGVHNLTELYLAARPVAAANAFAAQAEEDIRAETGGTPETRPDAYRERSTNLRLDDVAAAGLRGVAVVHAREDGQAAYNQAVALVDGLRRRRVPTDFFTVGSRGPQDDPDTTITSYAGADSGQAGHASDPSVQHVVPITGYDRVAAILLGTQPDPCGRDFTVEGAPTLRTTPDPARATAACPRAPARSAPAPAGATASTCAQALARTRLVSVRRRGRGLVITGRARRAACGSTGALRVEVAVVRRVRGGCRAVLRSGRLGPRTLCTNVAFRRAAGSSPFRARYARVPRGPLSVLTRAVDGGGRGAVRERRLR